MCGCSKIDAENPEIVASRLAEAGGRNNLNEGLNQELVHVLYKPLICLIRQVTDRVYLVIYGPLYNPPGGPKRRVNIHPAEIAMTTFDEREKGFEKKFALDQDLKFRSEARRNKLLAEWAAAKLGITGADLEDYIRAVRKADLEEKGDDDVFRKVRGDFDAKGIAVSDAEIRKMMGEFMAKAVHDIESTGRA